MSKHAYYQVQLELLHNRRAVPRLFARERGARVAPDDARARTMRHNSKFEDASTRPRTDAPAIYSANVTCKQSHMLVIRPF